MEFICFMSWNGDQCNVCTCPPIDHKHEPIKMLITLSNQRWHSNQPLTQHEDLTSTIAWQRFSTSWVTTLSIIMSVVWLSFSASRKALSLSRNWTSRLWRASLSFCSQKNEKNILLSKRWHYSVNFTDLQCTCTQRKKWVLPLGVELMTFH